MFTARSKPLHIDEFDSSNFSCCWLVRSLNYQPFRKCPRTIGTTELDGAVEQGLSTYPGKETPRVMSGRQFGAPILTSPFLFRLNVSPSFFFHFLLLGSTCSFRCWRPEEDYQTIVTRLPLPQSPDVIQTLSYTTRI